MRVGKRPSAGPRDGRKRASEVAHLNLARHLRLVSHGPGRQARPGLPQWKKRTRGVLRRFSEAFGLSQVATVREAKGNGSPGMNATVKKRLEGTGSGMQTLQGAKRAKENWQ